MGDIGIFNILKYLINAKVGTTMPPKRKHTDDQAPDSEDPSQIYDNLLKFARSNHYLGAIPFLEKYEKDIREHPLQRDIKKRGKYPSHITLLDTNSMSERLRNDINRGIVTEDTQNKLLVLLRAYKDSQTTKRYRRSRAKEIDELEKSKDTLEAETSELRLKIEALQRQNDQLEAQILNLERLMAQNHSTGTTTPMANRFTTEEIAEINAIERSLRQATAEPQASPHAGLYPFYQLNSASHSHAVPPAIDPLPRS